MRTVWVGWALLLAQAANAAPEAHENVLRALMNRQLDWTVEVLASQPATYGYAEDRRAAHELFRSITGCLRGEARRNPAACRRLVEAGLTIGRAALEEETADLERHEIMAESLTLAGAYAQGRREGDGVEAWIEGARHLERFYDGDPARAKAILRGVELLHAGGARDAARELVERAEKATPEALGVRLARAALDTETARIFIDGGRPSQAAPLLKPVLELETLARTPDTDLDVVTIYNDAVAVARSDGRTRLRPEFVMRLYVARPLRIEAPVSRRWTFGVEEGLGNLAMFEQWDTYGDSIRFLYVDNYGSQNRKGRAKSGERIMRSLFARYESRGKMVRKKLNWHFRAAEVLTFVGWDPAGGASRIRLYYFKGSHQRVYQIVMIEPGDSPRKMDPGAQAVIDSICEPED